jgi:hypothetical protein
MVNKLAIVASGRRRGREPHVMSPRCATFAARAAQGLGVAFANGAPARRPPLTAPLSAGLRATLTLPTPAFYSP